MRFWFYHITHFKSWPVPFPSAPTPHPGPTHRVHHILCWNQLLKGLAPSPVITCPLASLTGRKKKTNKNQGLRQSLGYPINRLFLFLNLGHFMQKVFFLVACLCSNECSSIEYAFEYAYYPHLVQDTEFASTVGYRGVHHQLATVLSDHSDLPYLFSPLHRGSVVCKFFHPAPVTQAMWGLVHHLCISVDN